MDRHTRCLVVDHAGKHWEIEIEVSVDFEEYGGIVADSARNGIYCIAAEFGCRKHCNEHQA